MDVNGTNLEVGNFYGKTYTKYVPLALIFIEDLIVYFCIREMECSGVVIYKYYYGIGGV
jgi:hypothetical protein